MLIDSVQNAAVFQWGVVLGASLVAALWDLTNRRIPNILTLPLLAAGWVQAAVFFGWAGLVDALLAGVIVGLPYVLLYAFASGGAGDAKLMAAIGAWLGMQNGIAAMVSISIVAIVFALCRVVWARRFFETLNNLRMILLYLMFFFSTRGRVKYAGGMETADDATALTMPYGPAIFTGLVGAALYCLML